MFVMWVLIGLIFGLLLGIKMTRRHYEKFIEESDKFHEEEIDAIEQSAYLDAERELSDDLSFVLKNYDRHFMQNSD